MRPACWDRRMARFQFRPADRRSSGDLNRQEMPVKGHTVKLTGIVEHNHVDRGRRLLNAYQLQIVDQSGAMSVRRTDRSFNRGEIDRCPPAIGQDAGALGAVAGGIETASGSEIFPFLRIVGESPRLELLVATDHG